MIKKLLQKIFERKDEDENFELMIHRIAESTTISFRNPRLLRSLKLYRLLRFGPIFIDKMAKKKQKAAGKHEFSHLYRPIS